eukprot:TRINITY_DN20_c1_g1_i1.p1 TRINITY_DN20_c1_g1~~TRINITY_DN20_c1_g1_i1.p1  ORF type:complete len:1239 (+),score=202.34 TRINITY_DN20_c1_g1_i1:142-3858(+)
MSRRHCEVVDDLKEGDVHFHANLVEETSASGAQSFPSPSPSVSSSLPSSETLLLSGTWTDYELEIFESLFDPNDPNYKVVYPALRFRGVNAIRAFRASYLKRLREVNSGGVEHKILPRNMWPGRNSKAGRKKVQAQNKLYLEYCEKLGVEPIPTPPGLEVRRNIQLSPPKRSEVNNINNLPADRFAVQADAPCEDGYDRLDADLSWINNLKLEDPEDLMGVAKSLPDVAYLPAGSVPVAKWPEAIAVCRNYTETFECFRAKNILDEDDWSLFEEMIQSFVRDVHAALFTEKSCDDVGDPKVDLWKGEIFSLKKRLAYIRKARRCMRGLRKHKDARFPSKSLRKALSKGGFGKLLSSLSKNPEPSYWETSYRFLGDMRVVLKRKKLKAGRRLKRSDASRERKKNIFLWYNKRKAFYKNLGNKNQGKISEEVFNSAVVYYTDENRSRNPPWFDVHSVPKILKDVLPFPDSELDMGEWNFSVAKVQAFLDTCNANSAAGWDKLQFQVWKRLEESHFILSSIFNVMFSNNRIPAFWQVADTCLIPKAKELKSGKDVRPINLQSTIYKIFSAILGKNLFNFAQENDMWSDGQRGFVHSYGTMLNLSMLQFAKDNILRSRGGKSLLALFVDIQNAFGAAEYKQLVTVLFGLGLPKRICMLIWNICRGGLMKFSFSSKKIFVPQSRGVKQGDPLSPIIFNLLLEPLLRIFKNHDIGYRAARVGVCVRPLGFADDLCILESCRDRLATAVDLMETYLDWLRFVLVPVKCSLLKMEFDSGCHRIVDDWTVSIKGVPVRLVDEFSPAKYLGVFFDTSKNSKDSAIKMVESVKRNISLLSEVQLPLFMKVAALNQWVAGKVNYSLQNCRVDLVYVKEMKRCVFSAVRAWFDLPSTASISLFTLKYRNGGIGLVDFITRYYSLIVSKGEYILAGKYDAEAFEVLMGSLEDSKRSRGVDYNFIGLENVPGDTIKSFWSFLHSACLKFELDKDFLSKDTVYAARRKAILIKAEELSHQGQILRSWRKLRCANREVRRNWRLADHYAKFWAKAFLQVLPSKAFSAYRGGSRNTRCELCGEIETQMHLLNGCSKRSDNFIIRHNMVQDAIVKRLHKHPDDILLIDTTVPDFYYSGSVPHNKPDIFWFSPENEEIKIIEVAVPYDRLVKDRIKDKYERYKPLAEALRKKYPEYEVTVFPIVIGSLGGFSSHLMNQLSLIGIIDGRIDLCIRDLFNAAIKGSHWVWNRRHRWNPSG